MMGAGADFAGGAPAGLDSGLTTERRDAAAPAALAFDGLTLDFQLDSRGRYVAAHPIDTKVFHRLRIRSLSVRSAPGTGNGVASRAYIDPQRIEAQVRDEIQLAVGDMIAAREIEEQGIDLDLSVRGRVMYVYRYVNLRTGKPGSFRST